MVTRMTQARSDLPGSTGRISGPRVPLSRADALLPQDGLLMSSQDLDLRLRNSRAVCAFC